MAPLEWQDNVKITARPWLVVLIGLSLSCAFSLQAWYGLRSLWWPKVEGKILESRLQPQTRISTGRRDARASITYSYQANGRRYIGDTISYGSIQFWRPFSLVKKYRKGKTVAVSVNPRKPYESALQPGYSFLDAFMILLGLVVALFPSWLKKRRETTEMIDPPPIHRSFE